MKKPQPRPAPKPRAPRVADSTSSALNRIVAILRPLSQSERAQVLRSVAAYYQE